MKIFPAFKKKTKPSPKYVLLKHKGGDLKTPPWVPNVNCAGKKIIIMKSSTYFFFKEKLKPSKRASWGYGSNWCHSERCAVSLRAAAPGGDGGIACVSAAPLP